MRTRFWFMVLALIIMPPALSRARVHLSEGGEVKIIYDVPNLVQKGPTCASTSLSMVLSYYGYEIADHNNVYRSSTFGHGAFSLGYMARKHGFRAKVKNHSDLDDIKNLIDHDIPVLASWYDPRDRQNPWYSSNRYESHWVVVVGYHADYTGRVTYIYFHDPNKDKPQRLHRDDFLELWRFSHPLARDKSFVLLAIVPPASPRYHYLFQRFRADFNLFDFLDFGCLYIMNRALYALEAVCSFNYLLEPAQSVVVCLMMASLLLFWLLNRSSFFKK